MTVVAINRNHLPMVRELVAQSPNYFGREYKIPDQVVTYVERLITSESQRFWGYEDQGRLLCMLGQRLLLKAPTWVENYVYLDKRTTRTYNLVSTHFLEVLDSAIRHAESTHRFSFLTAFPRVQAEARMRATQRALTRFEGQTALRNYMPSLWYDSGSFDDVNILLGMARPAPDSVILQWTRPLCIQGQTWNPWPRKSSQKNTP